MSLVKDLLAEKEKFYRLKKEMEIIFREYYELCKKNNVPLDLSPIMIEAIKKTEEFPSSLSTEASK